MATAGSPSTEKWGLTPSIRDSILTHQHDVKNKLKSGFRALAVVALVSTVLLGANFALTVTAVVSNKDVYVGGHGHRLVNSEGSNLEVAVAQVTTDIYDFPYQSVRKIAAAKVFIIPDGQHRLILRPSKFSYVKSSRGYHLEMVSGDGTIVSWGPPSMMIEGRLAHPIERKTITVTSTDGTVKKSVASLGRRLGGDDFGDGSVSGDDVQDFGGSQACSIMNSESRQSIRMEGIIPLGHGDGPFPLAIYLPGTHMMLVTGLSTAMISEMSGRGFVSVRVGYSHNHYPPTCDAFGRKARHISTCTEELCVDDNVDCAHGVAVFGWSQGGQEALLLGNHNTHVTAALSFSGIINNSPAERKRIQTSCFQSSALLLPKTHRRIVIGENDGYMGDSGQADQNSFGHGIPSDIITSCQAVSGYSTCHSTNNYDCIQSDGSGYIVVAASELKVGCQAVDNAASKACHWWFATVDKTTYQWATGFNSDFAGGTGEWGVDATFTWLAEVAYTGTDSKWDLTAGHRKGGD